MGGLPRDPFFYAHAAAVGAAAVWLFVAGGLLVLGIPAVIVLAAATAYLAVRERRSGDVTDLLRFPLYLFVADLAFASAWMVVTAKNDRSIAFIVVLFIGALASQSFGRRAITFTVGAFFVGRVGEEAYRAYLGTPTPPSQIVSEIGIVLLAVVVFAATLRSFGRVRERADAALRRTIRLGRVARDLTAETDPAAVLHSIPASALALVPAAYAALVMRRGDHFEISTGAGLAERVVGMRRSTEEGIFGDVLQSGATVALADYRTHPRAVVAARDLGIRSIVGVPIFVQGEMAACLVLGRLAIEPFDAEDQSAAEGLAAHASIAIQNARTLDLSRRLERLARVMPGWTTVESVYELLAREASDAFGTEFAFAVEILPGGGTRMVGGVGPAAGLVGRSYDRPGPLTSLVVERRESVYVPDYVGTFPLRPEDEPSHVDRGGLRGSAGLIARASQIHAIVAAPLTIADEVRAVLVVGSSEPRRTFNELDRQGIARLADVGATAVRAIHGRVRRERRLRRLTILNEAATRLASASSPQRVARIAWEVAGELVERDSFYVAQYDAERRLFHFILQEDSGTTEESGVPDGWDADMTVPLGDGPTSRVVLSGAPFVSRADDTTVAPRRFGDRTQRSAEAIHVPLRQGERVVGVLSAQSYSAGAYENEDVEILQSLGNLVAGALENLSQLARLRDLYLATVKALAAAVDARDPYTRSHSARVAALSRLMAEELRLSEDDVRRVQLGALLHDIGKIGIPDAILNKPSSLSPEEWVVMRSHPLLGASILEAVEPLADLVPIVRDHHEHYDGGGYPAGKSEDQVGRLAYIVAVADAYEVIVSKRSYKEAQSVEVALEELRRCRGTQFHPDVVDAFLRVIERDLAEGTRLLARVGALQQEEIEDVPGPGDLLQRYVARAQTHGRRLAVLQRLAGEIGAVLDIDDLASRLLRIVCDAMGYEHGFLTTLDRDTGELVVRAAFGPSDNYIGARIPKGVGVSAWVLEHGRLQNVGDVRTDARFYGPSDVLSNLIVPLRIEDEVVGVLGIESARRNAFTPDDEQLLTAVSHQIAAAIRVANLHSVARNAAATDPLTGLANRRAFFERLDAALAASANDGSVVTVAVADVDGLKVLNDRHGHRAGDEGLIRVGETLMQGVRSGDLVARIGGDEFAVMFHGPIFVADRVMRRVVERLAAATLTGDVSVPSISWGLAQATGSATSDEVMEIADRAMYRYKRRERLLKAE